MINNINENLLQKNKFTHKLRLQLFAEGLVVGIVAGLVISLFRFLLQYAETWRGSFYNQFNLFANLNLNMLWQNKFFIWLAALIIIAVILTYLVRHEPLASGSGIPQVKGALLNLIEMNWLRIIWVKITGGVLAIGAGLSLGREGPSIQLGAMVAQGISRILHHTKVEERHLISSGAAAGLAAAFNAPLAGIIFALEELHHNFSIIVLLPSMASAIAATFVSRLLFGGSSVFMFPEFTTLPYSACGAVILTSIFAGLAGVLFNKGLLNIHRFYNTKLFPNFIGKILFALTISIILGLTIPQVLGGGSELINYLAKTPVTLQFLYLLLLIKFIFTLISYGVGTPGGFFLPMLVIGALTGGVCAKILIAANLISTTHAMNILVIAMVAFFSASVKAPITGTVLIMEMSKSYSILLSCSIGAMIGFVLAELLQSKPIYEALLNHTLQQQKYIQLLQSQSLAERNSNLQNEDRYYSED